MYEPFQKRRIPPIFTPTEFFANFDPPIFYRFLGPPLGKEDASKFLPQKDQKNRMPPIFTKKEGCPQFFTPLISSKANQDAFNFFPTSREFKTKMPTGSSIVFFPSV